jgi:ribosomal protein L5
VNPVDGHRTVDRRNDTLTRVGDTYMVALTGNYATTIRHGEDIGVSVHMSEQQARELLAGLQEALGPGFAMAQKRA